MIFHAIRPMSALVARLAVMALVTWGVASILGGSGVAGASGGFGVLLAQEWRQRAELGGWAQQRRIALAVRATRDPGPGFRDPVDVRARWLVAQGTRAIWGPAAALGGAAAFLLGVAFLRSSSAPVWPAVALLLCIPGVVLAQWRAVALAALWLANAPEPSEVTPE